jgi:hypothetical protein
MVLPKDVKVLEPIATSHVNYDLLRDTIRAGKSFAPPTPSSHDDAKCSPQNVYHDSATAFETDIDDILRRMVSKSVYGDAEHEVAFSVLNEGYVFALKQHYANAKRFVPHNIFYIAL